MKSNIYIESREEGATSYIDIDAITRVYAKTNHAAVYVETLAKDGRFSVARTPRVIPEGKSYDPARLAVELMDEIEQSQRLQHRVGGAMFIYFSESKVEWATISASAELGDR